MYKVIRYFTDLLDNNHPYNVGDVFPHEGCKYPVSDERLAELAGDKNKQKAPLIEFVEPKQEGQDAEDGEKSKRGRKAAEK